MKGSRRAVRGEHTSEHLQSEVAERLAAQVLLDQREAMLSSSEQWVPPLAPYEKGVTPTEMKRASDGSGKQPVRRDGIPGPSDLYSRAATRNEDADSEDEGGGKRPMYPPKGGKSPMHPYTGGKGLMSLQASQEERQEQPEGRLEELEDLAGMSEGDLRDELIMYERQPQQGEALRSLQLRVLLARARLPDYTDEDSLIDVAKMQEDLQFLAQARRQRDDLREEVEDRMDEYVSRGYDVEGYSAHMAAAIQYEELVTSLTEKMQENWRALLRLQEQQMVVLDDMYRRAQRTPVPPVRKGAAATAEQKHAQNVKKLEEQIRLLESWREEEYDHMFSMKWTTSTWAYGDGKRNPEGTYNGYGQENKWRLLYPKWKEKVKVMYDNLTDNDSDGFLRDETPEELDAMIKHNIKNPFNLEKASPQFLDEILKLANKLNTVFKNFRRENYLKERGDRRTPHDVEEELGEIEKWRRVINEKLYPNLRLDQNPVTAMSEDAIRARQVQQERARYREKVELYLDMRKDLAQIKFSIEALRKQVVDEGRDLTQSENDIATLWMSERNELLVRAEAAFTALKYDAEGNVTELYERLPYQIKLQMGDRRGDRDVWVADGRAALKDF
tara:strand:- start:289 stop:2130 length:1842 start_codon:yes stop_codon:yes gene_type:complete